MGFMDEYKHLEKICGDMLGDSRKVSAYIDEMKQLPDGVHWVPGWEEDLRRLKQYRGIRNKIAHEPGYTEENMCEPEDVLWLENFYDRILHQEDPLALYRRAVRRKKVQSTGTVNTPSAAFQERKPEGFRLHRKKAAPPARLIAVLVVVLLLAIAFLLYWSKGLG